MSKFEFVDHLPGATAGAKGNDLIDEFAAALKERPGEWAKWPTKLSKSTVYSYPNRINAGELRAFRSGGFEAAAREAQLYVRYIGGAL